MGGDVLVLLPAGRLLLLLDMELSESDRVGIGGGGGREVRICSSD